MKTKALISFTVTANIDAVNEYFFCCEELVPLKSCKIFRWSSLDKQVQVGSDQEKAQSERNSHSKNGGGKKQNGRLGTYT